MISLLYRFGGPFCSLLGGMADENRSPFLPGYLLSFFPGARDATVGDVSTDTGVIRLFVAGKGDFCEQLWNPLLLLWAGFTTHA